MLRDHVEVRPYDPRWPELFEQEKAHLHACLPRELVRRIEHFGSTAVPGLAAKPIVDLLVEVTDLQAARERIAPILEAQGYDYFWRPTHGDDLPPFYAWFIKRDPATGVRTHHVHMIEASEEFREHWDRLLFRDHLIAHPERAREYERLKLRLAAESPGDRIAYTRGKTEFILGVTREARRARARGERSLRGKGEPVQIRPFEDGDEDAVIAVWERSGLLRPWNDPRKDIARKLRVQRDLFLVGTLDDAVVATVMGGYDGHRGWVNYLAVEPSLRRRGLGREIMDALRHRLRELGCPKINLQIRKDNLQAVAFYERLGFVEDHSISLGLRLERDEP